MTGYQEFVQHLTPPAPGKQFATPTKQPTLRTIVEWRNTQGIHREPGRVRDKDVRDFETQHRLIPRIWKVSRSASRSARGLRQGNALGESYGQFLQGLQQPAPGQRFATPTVQPTLETIVEWRNTQGIHQTGSQMRNQDVRDFETEHDLILGSNHLVRDVQYRAVGLRQGNALGESYGQFLLGLQRPAPGQRFATPAVQPTLQAIVEWVDTLDTNRPPGQGLRDQDVRMFETQHHIIPGRYQLERSPHGVLLSLREVNTPYGRFLQGLQQPAPGQQFATPTVQPTLQAVAGWLDTQGGARRPLSEMRAKDVEAFEIQHNLTLGGYQLVRNARYDAVGLRQPNALGESPAASTGHSPNQSQHSFQTMAEWNATLGRAGDQARAYEDMANNPWGLLPQQHTGAKQPQAAPRLLPHPRHQTDAEWSAFLHKIRDEAPAIAQTPPHPFGPTPPRPNSYDYGPGPSGQPGRHQMAASAPSSALGQRMPTGDGPTPPATNPPAKRHRTAENSQRQLGGLGPSAYPPSPGPGGLGPSAYPPSPGPGGFGPSAYPRSPAASGYPFQLPVRPQRPSTPARRTDLRRRVSRQAPWGWQPGLRI